MKKRLLQRLERLLSPNGKVCPDVEALERAYARFAESEPEWAASLFDRHFVAHHVAPILLEGSSDGPETAAADIARAWAEQWNFGSDLVDRSAKRSMPAAKSFLEQLCAVRAEMKASYSVSLPDYCVPQVSLEQIPR